jgi:hypothetical protein
MSLEKQSFGQTFHRWASQNTFMVLECLVDRGHNKVCHLRTHSVLHLQGDTAFSIVDHSFKERDIKVVAFAKLVDSNSGTKLLVIT